MAVAQACRMMAVIECAARDGASLWATLIWDLPARALFATTPKGGVAGRTQQKEQPAPPRHRTDKRQAKRQHECQIKQRSKADCIPQARGERIARYAQVESRLRWRAPTQALALGGACVRLDAQQGGS